MAVLEVRDLVVGYGRFPVLHGIDFVVEEGEVCVLLGLNGAGKTTTVATIAGLLRPTSGKVAFEGKSLGRKPPSARVKAGISLCPEGRRVFPRLSVQQNLRLGGWTRRRSPRTVKQQLELVLDYFPRLEERADQVAGTLSGGEQQMLAVGRALMSNPKLLMIDEASMGLSPTLARTVWEATARIARDGTTVFMVEQNAGALPFADRALIMEKGTLVHHAVGEDIRNVNLREAYLGA
jgi:branched-chain amino acid transport system ATP-binding protein